MYKPIGRERDIICPFLTAPGSLVKWWNRSGAVNGGRLSPEVFYR